MKMELVILVENVLMDIIQPKTMNQVNVIQILNPVILVRSEIKAILMINTARI